MDAPRMTLQPIPEGGRNAAVVVDAGLVKVVEATGAGDPQLAVHWLSMAGNVGPAMTETGPALKATLEHRNNLALATVHGVAPRDALEGMLAMQLHALHGLTMDAMGRVARAEPDQRERTVREATRLQGAFLATVETLRRGRGATTVQRVVVERVTVEAGGQAVVGAVVGGGGREGGGA
jgi:hypothetical protein